MSNKKEILTIIVITLMCIGLLGCSNKNPQQTVDNMSPGEVNDGDISKEQEAVNDTKVNEDTQAENTPNIVSKVEGRRKEFIERLDDIQKEIEALPEKKDSDAGVTNAMKNYYGRAYEMYDKELNDIYALLKEELSPEIMNELEAKQIKWIAEKEEKAREEESKYKGGTFEFVAGYISLYESTKEKCYELVNDYMTD